MVLDDSIQPFSFNGHCEDTEGFTSVASLTEDLVVGDVEAFEESVPLDGEAAESPALPQPLTRTCR
jgi:hypothetical protein